MKLSLQMKLLGYRVFPRAFAKLYWSSSHRQGSTVARVFDAYIKPNGDVIDVGASLGVFSIRFLETVGKSGRVHAVEPQERAAASLKRLKRIYPNFSFDEIALSDSVGEAALSIPVFDGHADHGRATLQSESAADSAVNVAVRTATLDSVIEANQLKPDFIKIDVEGHEYEVLTGGRKSLEQFHPTMLIEIIEKFRPERFDATFELLHELGYNVFAVAHDGLIPLHEFDKERDQTPYAGDPRFDLDERFLHDFLAVAAANGDPPADLFRSKPTD